MAGKAPKGMRGPTKDALNNILDTFSGADGGVGFTLFRQMMDVVDEQAAKGDKPSEEVVRIMLRFSRLIDVAKKQQPGIDL